MYAQSDHQWYLDGPSTGKETMRTNVRRPINCSKLSCCVRLLSDVDLTAKCGRRKRIDKDGSSTSY
ncbi:hypothetical protein M514_09757 [Trichuris suis]|uniref:Uncharacterized protein n=1 Tax=Trichuris suis TaxID=68888 RepID=A0A085N4Z3_9BILA|nr:hypothetical protein M513_09757 [Trichuris suis]KFD64539.1 hypothetical protein M514_09757 [Trichuris suis]